ncbi:hypothetical protein NQ314_018157 [Rhamnusium bicolor]|uniref:Myb/SANT-like DNA-binding domain-containing protein n=1 Tax=Rhamnusium bicolor TaxID=1586634 RepID=A0AAV8WRN0_9CUCU|nr:hypothetical protein NQ314_018157 [Rhamnusium bicolor]
MKVSDLLEYVILPVGSSNEDSHDSYRWTHGDTLVFLDLYETYRKQVGTLRVKSFKKMFEEISKEIKIKTGKNITPTNCENRWKVLERAYKKYILNINTTGSARKEFDMRMLCTKFWERRKISIRKYCYRVRLSML